MDAAGALAIADEAAARDGAAPQPVLVRYERLEIETETLASAQEGKLGVTWRRSPQRE